MKANIFQKVIIVIKSIWTILWTSIITISFARSKEFDKSHKAFTKMGFNLLRYIGVKLNIFNPHNVTLTENRPYIIMSNHASLYDIPIILSTFPDQFIRMFVKKELMDVPIWGNAMIANGFVTVDRENKADTIKSLRLAKKNLESGIILWMSPEGTRSKTGELLPFKDGGFALAKMAKAIIIPVGIYGAHDILPAKSKDLNICQEVKVFIEKPVDSTNQEYKTVEDLRKYVENCLRSSIDLLKKGNT